MKKLNFYTTSEIDELAWPSEKKDVSLDSPALEFFTDFLNVEPLVIESTASVIDVKRLMQKTHTRLKIVVNSNDDFVGVISSEEIIDRLIVHKISEGIKREDITVADLMRPKKELMALDIDEISTAKISDVIEALKDNGQQHCLVLERDTHKVRGIFSASDISRKLHLSIDIQDASSFLKVFTAMK